MKRCSLRIRLLRMIAIPLAVGIIGIGVSSYLSAKHEAEEIYDAQLAHFARVLGLLTQHEIDEGDVAEKVIHLQPGKFHTAYEKDFAYRVWLGGDILMQSDNAVPLGELTQASGFTDRMVGPRMWRIFVLREGNVTVEVAEDYHARLDLVEKVGFSVLLPCVFILPLLIGVIWWGVRYGVGPLDKLSAHVQALRPEALQPVELEVIPREVMPLVEALNQLMRRVEEVIEREKRFTGYAAHELRTPLAALKTQVQVALHEKNAQTQQAMFAEVEQGIDRMAHLVEQLLALVRAQKAQMPVQEVDLSALAENMADGFVTPATARNQTLRRDIETELKLNGNPDMLAVLLRNLLDNAIRYSPEEAVITLKLKHRNGHPSLCVSNTGVTLSPEQRERIFEPFYRGGSETSGAGLGLAIVGWIAKRHGASLACESGQGSVSLTVDF